MATTAEYDGSFFAWAAAGLCDQIVRLHRRRAELDQPACLEHGEAVIVDDGGQPVGCVVQDANMGHHLAGGNSSWCPELEYRTTHRWSGRCSPKRSAGPAGDRTTLLARGSSTESAGESWRGARSCAASRARCSVLCCGTMAQP